MTYRGDPPPSDAPKERVAGRRHMHFAALAFVAFLVVVQVPLCLYAVARGAPIGAAALGFALMQSVIIVRIRYLPKPLPPPVWFERWLVWGFFAIAAVGAWFTPLGGLAWLLGRAFEAHAAAILDASFGLSILLGALAAGIPWRRVVVRVLEVPIAGLPMAFDGFRIAHLTDLHSGPLVPERWIRSWAEQANALSPDLVALTGDLIAAGDTFIPHLERGLSPLKAPVVAVLGNHDYFGGAAPALRAMHGRLGHKLLDNRHVVLLRGDDRLVIAGTDDTWTGSDDLDAALASAPRDVPVVLLAHDPVLFGTAVTRGVELQLSGHVHGGQVAIPGLGLAGSPLVWLGFPFVRGLYRRGRSQLWLGAGLGTTGAPIRVGVPSELPLLILRRAPDRR
ncbi:MAG: metallophosphoesterase [Myxococcales bacterium]|nr:metallophosphoesterase [Myxococcales bacterium]